MGVGDSYIKEHDIDGNAISIPTSALKIITDLSDKCICKIQLKPKGSATGFFCAIPFPDKYNRLPVLVTNNHVLNKNNIMDGKTVKFSIKNDEFKFEIKLDVKRKRYTNEKYDITFIEIKKDIDNLDIDTFLDIDEDIFEENYENKLDKKSVYLLHYPFGNLSEYTSGIIKGFFLDEKFVFMHSCQTQKGSSGSPIINITKHKVIGIHKGFEKNKNFNLGTLLKEPINEFYIEREEYFNNSICSIDFNDNESLVVGVPREKKGSSRIYHSQQNILFVFCDEFSYSKFCLNMTSPVCYRYFKNVKISFLFFDILFNIYQKKKNSKLTFPALI